MISNRIIFKNFEVRSCGVEDQKYDYELVKWKDARCSTFCCTLAFLKYDPKDGKYNMVSVGTRFFDDYESGLCEFLSAFLTFAEKAMELRTKNETK